MTDKDAAQSKIRELVKNYHELSLDLVRSYSEEDTKQEYIQALFEALGWNTRIRSEVRKEEKTQAGYPDYSFILNGTTAFFLEAKRFNSDLTEHLQQAINYAYIKGVRWAILTNFKELMVFNADWDVKNPLKARFMNLKCDQYGEGRYFDRLWLLSKESMLKHEIDTEAELEGRETRTKVEKVLFSDLTKWRQGLFEDIRKYRERLEASNPELVDEAIQRFLDRLIFIRTVEDRHIENQRLRATLRQYDAKRGKDKNLFRDILELFAEMDKSYNARLFEAHAIDRLSVQDENLVRTIIDGLYDVKGTYAKYDFAVIDADVLGAVYEQYLSFKAKDPEGKDRFEISKRTKRKARGIYYTPKFIVRYMVRETLGKLLQSPDMTVEKAHNLKILDPACGSGSFLVEAFRVLDEWLAINGDETDRNFPRRRGMRILRENIYGVDLDSQAVEVAQLNLHLKVAYERAHLEGLTHIQQANTLINDETVVSRELAFKWEERFPEVKEHDGFDIVIGNPPYFNIETLGKDSELTASIKSSFPNVWMDKSDILFYFMAKGIELFKDKFAYIVSRSFLEADKAQKLRSFIIDNCIIESVIDFRDFKVFEDADIATAIIILRPEKDVSVRIEHDIQIAQVASWDSSGAELIEKISHLFSTNEPYFGDDIFVFSYPQKSLTSANWAFASDSLKMLWEHIDGRHPKLGDICYLGEGMQTGANDVFEVSEATIRQEKLETSVLRKRALNSDIKRYGIEHSGNWLIYVEDFTNFEDCPQNVKNHLEAMKETLEKRAAYIRGNCEWYKFTWPLHKTWYKYPKLMTPYRAKENSFALDESGDYIGLTDTTNVFPLTEDKHDLKYYLGLLNSRLLTFRFKGIGKLTGAGMYEYFENGIKRLPIRTINFDDPLDIKHHDDMVKLVKEMLQLKREYIHADELLTDKRNFLEIKIKSTQKAIDNLVYELYGLNKSDIRIVEGA